MNKIISIPPFYRDLMVHFGSIDELRATLHKYVNEDIVNETTEGLDESMKGMSHISQDKGVFYIWMPYKPETPEDMGFLAHEIFHAVVMMFEVIGAEPSSQSEEFYAYTIGYLMERIIEEFRLTVIYSSCHAPQQ